MLDRRRPNICALFLLSNLPLVFSQIASILPSTPSSSFPACGLSCPGLNAASSFCTQSNVGASQEVLNSCFCKRAEVTPFYQSPTGVCDASCAADADRSTLQTWFKDYCAAAGVSGSDDETRTTLITSTRTPTSTANGVSDGGSKSSSSQDGGWFASHWQWVLMVILLAIGLGALAILARYLKRRHTRKVEQRRAALPGLPDPRAGSTPDVGRDMWGPHQHMAHTGGWEYTSDQDREMRQASTVAGGGALGTAIGKARNFRKDRNRKLGKTSQHSGHRSSRQAEKAMDTARGMDERTRDTPGAVRTSRKSGKAQRKREREIDSEPYAAMTEYDEKAGKERQKASLEARSRPEATEKS